MAASILEQVHALCLARIGALATLVVEAQAARRRCWEPREPAGPLHLASPVEAHVHRLEVRDATVLELTGSDENGALGGRPSRLTLATRGPADRRDPSLESRRGGGDSGLC